MSSEPQRVSTPTIHTDPNGVIAPADDPVVSEFLDAIAAVIIRIQNEQTLAKSLSVCENKSIEPLGLQKTSDTGNPSRDQIILMSHDLKSQPSSKPRNSSFL